MTPQILAPPNEQEAKAEYLEHLQSLADVCRNQPEVTYATAGELAELLALVQTLSDQVSALRDEKSDLEHRLATVEKATPSPQTWKNLILGIRSIRESVGQIQQQQSNREPHAVHES